MLYVTTDKFLRVFGLNSLSELPETEALSIAAAQVDANEASEEQETEPEEAMPEGEYTEITDPESEQKD
jgi:hypothetical protein